MHCCAAAPGEPVAATAMRPSTSCATCAPAPRIKCRWSWAWPGCLGLAVHGHIRDALRLTSDYLTLLETISEPTLTVGLLYPVIHAKYEAGEMAEALTLSQRVIDLADGDPIKGNLLTGSPLAFATAMRASARCALGRPNWKDDFDHAIVIARVDPTTYVSTVMFKYVLGISVGTLLPDSVALDDTAQALETGNDAVKTSHCTWPTRSRHRPGSRRCRPRFRLRAACTSSGCCTGQGIHPNRRAHRRPSDRNGKSPKRRPRRRN